MTMMVRVLEQVLPAVTIAVVVLEIRVIVGAVAEVVGGGGGR